jgi:hypothetical protein
MKEDPHGEKEYQRLNRMLDVTSGSNTRAGKKNKTLYRIFVTANLD